MITEHRILRATIFYHFAYLCKNGQLLYIYSFFTPVNIRYVNNLTITSKYHYLLTLFKIDTFNLRKHGVQAVIRPKSGPETLDFVVRKPWFLTVI